MEWVLCANCLRFGFRNAHVAEFRESSGHVWVSDIGIIGVIVAQIDEQRFDGNCSDEIKGIVQF